MAQQYGNPEFEKMRKTLLNHYHSENITHSGFIIALIIGTLGLLANWVNFFDRGTVPILVLYLIFSLVLGLAFYAGGRIYYWTMLSNSALILTEKKFEKYKIERQDKSKIENKDREESELPDIAYMQIYVANSSKFSNKICTDLFC